jgi:cysteine sulfinate desulfinase/cysteine desulfurase-like protein
LRVCDDSRGKLDNNATTRLDSAVIEEMLPFFSEYYGNPWQFLQRIRVCREKAESY